MNANHEDRFDAAIRAHHQASLDRLSPRTQAQLAQRRNTALRGEGMRRGHGFRYAAAGFAALGALAIGLQFGTLPTTTGPATATAIERSSIRMIGRDDIAAEIDKLSSWVGTMVEALSNRFVEINERLLELERKS